MYENVLTGAWGATLAVGDVDGDGIGDILVGQGEGGGTTATFSVHTADGTVLAEPIKVFEDARFGVHLAVGDFE